VGGAGKPAFLPQRFGEESCIEFYLSRFSFFGALAAPWIGVKLGKRHTYWISLILGAFAFLLTTLIEANTWTFTVIFCIGTMLCWIAGSMSTALFADTVVYGEWKTGKNIQAFTMSLPTLPLKLGLLIRRGVIMVGLMNLGFIAQTTPTPEVVSGISSIMIYSPVVTCAAAVAIFYFGYRIKDKHVLQMQDEIAAK
jgi:Na+/melibiose symporter-like transporter